MPAVKILLCICFRGMKRYSKHPPSKKLYGYLLLHEHCIPYHLGFETAPLDVLVQKTNWCDSLTGCIEIVSPQAIPRSSRKR